MPGVPQAGGDPIQADEAAKMSVHCIPNNDEREHIQSVECWCDGLVEWLDPDTGLPWANGSYRMIHNAADCREYSEEVTGDSMEPGKNWSVVEAD